MNLSNLKPAQGSRKDRKRIGRGPGYGWGKPAGRGVFRAFEVRESERSVLGLGSPEAAPEQEEDAETEDQLESVLESAREESDSFTLIEAKLDPFDRSPALDRLAARLARKLRGGGER